MTSFRFLGNLFEWFQIIAVTNKSKIVSLCWKFVTTWSMKCATFEFERVSALVVIKLIISLNWGTLLRVKVLENEAQNMSVWKREYWTAKECMEDNPWSTLRKNEIKRGNLIRENTSIVHFVKIWPVFTWIWILTS